MANNTLRYEFDFIHYLDGKKFSELSDKWKKHLKRMFPGINDDTVIHCSKHENYFAKGDIDIRIKGFKKIISLKNGKNACMHRERATWFFDFLKSLGVSYKTIRFVNFYHFGANNFYGHKDKPLTKEEIAAQFSDEILKANKELNQEKVVNAVIERSVIKGRQEERLNIDYFYYGNIEKGILLSIDQIYESIKSRKVLSNSWIQFGQLVYQAGGRSRENNGYLETTIHWPVLSKLFYVAEDEDDILKCEIDKK